MTREEHIYQLEQYLRGQSICMCPSSSLYWKEHWEEVVKALEQEPILEKINKMKSEIADSLEFWDYSPNNNPLARDMLETITNVWGDIRGNGI